MGSPTIDNHFPAHLPSPIFLLGQVLAAEAREAADGIKLYLPFLIRKCYFSDCQRYRKDEGSRRQSACIVTMSTTYQ